jgi:hypothetical protein
VLSWLLEIFFLGSPMPEGNTMMVERQVSIDTIDAINFSLVARVEHRDPENARGKLGIAEYLLHSSIRPFRVFSLPFSRLATAQEGDAHMALRLGNLGMFASPVVSRSVPRRRAAATDT